jgi:hypothetical protein
MTAMVWVVEIKNDCRQSRIVDASLSYWCSCFHGYECFIQRRHQPFVYGIFGTTLELLVAHHETIFLQINQLFFVCSHSFYRINISLIFVFLVLSFLFAQQIEN